MYTLRMVENGSHHRFRREKIMRMGPTVAGKTQGKWPKNAAKSTSDGRGTVDRCGVGVSGGVRGIGGHLGHLAGVGRGDGRVSVRCHHKFSFCDFSANPRSNLLKI